MTAKTKINIIQRPFLTIEHTRLPGSILQFHQNKIQLIYEKEKSYFIAIFLIFLSEL